MAVAKQDATLSRDLMALIDKVRMTWETRLRSVRKIQFGIFSTKHTCTPSCAFKRKTARYRRIVD